MRLIIYRTLFISFSVSALPANGHHSFAAIFDATNAIDVTGTVTAVEWQNPHVWFYIDVENSEGGIDNWGFEMGGPNGLMRRGWNRNTLKNGDVINVTGYRARDGGFTAAVDKVELTTGQELFGGQNPAN